MHAVNDLDAILTTIAKHAATLRGERIQSVTVGEVSFVLLPPPEPEAVPLRPQPEPRLNPLNDPATYGLDENSPVPGFRDPRKAST